ncbi:MAG: hypothetical protein AAGC55_27890, partial [Myxococcota bacterium]
GIGRPAPAGYDPTTASHLIRSRHDFEFLYARRPNLYRSVAWVGNLDHALGAETFAELLTWLARDRQPDRKPTRRARAGDEPATERSTGSAGSDDSEESNPFGGFGEFR